VGFGVAATGGPLALAALFVPGAVGTPSSVALVSVLGVLVFAVPVAVWYRYSERIASSGGLFSFVEASAGRRVALVQGGIWIISYFLYLPYTIAYVVYDLLPVVFPGIGGLRPLLELVLPVSVAALAFLPLRSVLVGVAALVCAQLAVLVALAVAGVAHVGVTVHSFGAHGPVAPLARSTADVSLLYVCTSLPLFLGGEVTGGTTTVKKGLVAGFGIAGAFVVIGALPWARAGSSVLRGSIPGVSLAQAAGGHRFGTLVGVGVAASVGGVVVAEYLALSRLVHAMSGRSIRTASTWVAAGFLVSSALSLIDPQAFYDELLKPSLVALWVSQLLVFLVYPLWEKTQRRLGPMTVGLAAGAAALMAYGLYEAATAVTS
jgi:amino acid transporter